MKNKASPRQVMRIQGQVEESLWNEYKSYGKVLSYIKRWQEEVWDVDNTGWNGYNGVNFKIEYKDESKSQIDVNKTLNNMSDDILQEIHGDLLGVKMENNIGDFFNQDGCAIRVLDKKGDFCNLNLYIRECKSCIDTGNLIAATLLLRCCVEDFVNIKLKPENGDRTNLNKKMGELIKKIENGDGDFAMIVENGKVNEVESFLTEIRNLGNDTAHLNGKRLQDFIDKYDLSDGLRSFCYLIECSILKADIEELRSEDDSERLRSATFKLNKKKKAEIDLGGDDDEIPF